MVLPYETSLVTVTSDKSGRCRSSSRPNWRVCPPITTSSTGSAEATVDMRNKQGRTTTEKNPTHLCPLAERHQRQRAKRRSICGRHKYALSRRHCKLFRGSRRRANILCKCPWSEKFWSFRCYAGAEVANQPFPEESTSPRCLVWHCR